MPVGTPAEVRLVAEEEPSIILTMREAADGAITGTLSEGGESMPVTARRSGAGSTGTVGPGGGTGVSINGRDLPPADLVALERITGQTPPGRYFITAQGLAGHEGGPPLWDLAALAARSGGGGSNRWQSKITGGSGFTDGHTGAVFLPNGGIVSTGD